MSEAKIDEFPCIFPASSEFRVSETGSARDCLLHPESHRTFGSSATEPDDAASAFTVRCNRVVDAFRRHFFADRVRATGPAPASEDFGSFGADWHAPGVLVRWRH
jgi:hypothetical protein